MVNDGQNIPLASIHVVEIKRPMRNDFADGAEDNPIQQVLRYVKKIRAGGVSTVKGRRIPESEDIPAFCYVLADITPTLEECAETSGLIKTSDKLGYFGYIPAYKAYVEVMGFDRLITAAKERNRAFFDRLGFSSN